VDAELEAFKTDIDLRQYAASLGYEWDKRESWRGSTVMRDGADKIFIKRNGNGHYVFFSVRDDADNGTIVDFTQRRKNLNLGQVRKELRPWLGRPVSPNLPLFPALEKTTKDRLRVETEYQRMQDLTTSPYLEARGLPADLLMSDRFAGRVRLDGRGNVVFPHFDADGLCGYELKNRNFTGFSAGGEKGLWLSHEGEADTRLVICEGAIDALSHAVLFPCPTARYASVGGKLNPRQPALLEMAITRLPRGAVCVAAMDADDEGGKLSQTVLLAAARVLDASGRSDPTVTEDTPTTGKDWNEQLQAARPAPKSSFPIAQRP
jgi:hypothetical protein